MVLREAIGQNLVLPYLGEDYLFLEQYLCCYLEGPIKPPYISFLKRYENSSWNQSRKKIELSFGCEKKVCITFYKFNRRFHRKAIKNYAEESSRGSTDKLFKPKIWVFEIKKADSVHVLTWCERGLQFDKPAEEPILKTDEDFLSFFEELPSQGVNFDEEMNFIFPLFDDEQGKMLDEFHSQQIIESYQRKLKGIFDEMPARRLIKKKAPRKRRGNAHKKNTSHQ